jgi:alkaline phosphatase D
MESDRSNVTVEGTVDYFNHETEKYIKASNSPICVDWTVSLASDLVGEPVRTGQAYTTSDIDYTIKVWFEWQDLASYMLTLDGSLKLVA